MTRDAELKLLVDLCGSALRGEQKRDVGAAHDWSRFVQLGRRHRVQGLAWSALSGGTESSLPHISELFEDTQAIAHRNLVAVVAADRLRDEFRRAGLAIVFLKGLTLGALVYRQAMLKMSADVDVLVDPAQLDAVEKCLLGLGYEPEGRRRSESRRIAEVKEWTWVGNDNVVVDLHARLADNPLLLSTISAHSATEDVAVSPGIVLQTLKREDLFAYLCVHGTSSAWFRLKWAADLAAFLRRCNEDEMEGLYRSSEASGAGRCPDVALLVVERLFGPLIPPGLIARAARDPISRLLAAISIHELTEIDEPLDRPLGTMLIHFSQLLMGRGIGFPIRDFRRQLSNSVA